MAAVRKKTPAKRKPTRAHGTRSREKGKEGERVVANRFRDRWPEYCKHARRGLQDRDGIEHADVEGVPGLFIEVKKQKKANVRAALEQVKEACKDGRRPMVVIKDDKKPPFVVLTQDDFMAILDWHSWKRINDGSNEGPKL
ncbi:hypothetical protein LCGC14_0460330 [marine sediment metagenome]|uniref:Holliday junction resolvase n=1 Tax=marine sediment metagenome TaxID=412755 RepID=A0A0F9VP53_9ZZZZ